MASSLKYSNKEGLRYLGLSPHYFFLEKNTIECLS